MTTPTTVVTIDQIQVVTNGNIQVRETTTITENGKEPIKSYARWTLYPGQDVSTQDPKVQAVCTATWTPEVIAAYNAAMAQNQKA